MKRKPSKAATPETKGQRDTRLGKEYGISSRQVRNWRDEGAPLDEPKKMSIWIASRQKQPIGEGEFDKLTNLTDAKLEKIRIECRRLDRRDKEEAGHFAVRSEVESKLTGLVVEITAELRRVFERELPPVQEGLNAAEIRHKNGGALDAMFTRWRERAVQCAG